MNIFDPHITGSLSVSSSAEISGDLRVLGTIYGTAEITGEVTNAISASHASSYLLTSSFEIYTASLDDTFATDNDVTALRGTLNTYTSSNNTTNTTQNGRLSSLEVKTGSLDTSISTINTLNTTQNNRLNSIEATTGSINLFTSSIETRVDDLETFSSSLDSTFATDSDVTTLRTNFNTYTSSNDTTNSTQNSRLGSLETKTGSLDSTNTTQNSRIGSLETKTGSLETTNTTQNGRLTSLETKTGSLETTNTTQNSRLLSIENATSSLDGRLDTIELGLEFTGSNLTIKGNLLVKGTQTTVNSTTVSIEDNIISLNGSGAANGGIEVRDVTSPGILSGSLIWDGLNNQWKGGTKSNEERLLTNTDLVGLDGRLDSIESFTASIDDTYATDADVNTLRTSLNTYTSSNDATNTTQNGRLTSLEVKTGSLDSTNTTQNNRLSSLETKTGSLDTSISTINTLNTTQNGRLTSLETKTGSLETTNTTQNGRLGSLETKSGSVDTSISNINTKLSGIDVTTGSLDSRIGVIEDAITNLDDTYATDSDITTLRGELNTYTSSNNTTNTTQNSRLGSLETESGSIRSTLNSYTSSNNTTIGNIAGDLLLKGNRLDSIEQFTASIDDTFATDSDVTTLRGDLNTYTSSNNTTNTTQNSRLGSLETESGSIRTAFNSYTSSNNTTNTTQNSRLGSLEVATGSLSGRLVSLETFSSSLDSTFATDSDVTALRGTLNTYTSSNDTTNTTQNSRLTSLETFSSSLDNTFATDSDVTALRGALNTYTSSNDTTNTTQNSRLGSLETKTGSLDTSISTINTLNTTQNTRLSSLETKTGSLETTNTTQNGRLSSLETESGSVRSTLNTYTASNDTTNTTQNSRLGSLETKTGSLDSTNSTQNSRISSLEVKTGSLDSTNTTQNGRLTSLETKTGSLDTTNTTQNGRLGSIETYTSSLKDAVEVTGSNLTIKGNLLVKGTQTTINATTVEVSDNIISLNGSGASFGGIEVRDTTAPNLISGSFLWDATNNFWVGGPKGLEQRILDDTDLTLIDGRLDSLELKSGSLNSKVISLETESGSIRTAFNSYTSSNNTTNTTQNGRLTSLETESGSVRTAFNSYTSSNNTTNTTQNSRLGSLETESGSIRTAFNTYVLSNDATNTTQNGRLTSLESATGSYTTTDYYTTGSTFNTTNGVITFTRNDGGTYTVDIDGKYSDLTHTHTFASITSKPTTLSGYGITDAASSTHTHTFSSLTSKPSTLSGYGITDAATSTQGTNADTAYGWGNHASVGYLTLHPSVSAAISSNNSGRTYIQDILLDVFGHITGITTATETVVNTDTNYYVTGATFSTSTGIITITKNDGSTVTVDIDGKYAESTHTHTFASITSKPTTLSGYGITDAATSAQGTKADTAYGWGNHASAGYLTSLYGTATSDLFLNNFNLTGVNNITIGDPGPGEGITWGGGNGWSIYESPNDLATNTAGNLQFVRGVNRVMTLDTSNNVTFLGTITASGYNATNWNTAYGWGNHAGLYSLVSHTHTFASITSKPTTLSGYGITDAASSTHTHTFASITSKPTTLSGYGITDAATSTQGTNADTAFGWGNHASAGYQPAGNYLVDTGTSFSGEYPILVRTSQNTAYSHLGIKFRGSDNTLTVGGTVIANGGTSTNWNTAYGWGNHAGLYSLVSHTHTFASLTSKPTTLVGYGITDAATSAQGTKADTAYGWGNHASAGYLTDHPSVTASVSSNNSGRTYIQDILLDSFGHITGITTATETVVNTNNYVTGATFSTSTGIITLTRSDGGTVTVDIDGKYAESVHNHTTLTGVTSIGFAAEASDLASISTTINGSGTYFDFNLTDDNNNDWWRWRFTPSGSVVYDAMILKPSSNGNADLTISGNVFADNLSISNWNTAYGWGNHASAGYLTAHPSVTAAGSSNNSGRTYIQDILLDGFGHITGITTATETVVNTDTNYYTTGSTFNSTNGIATFTRNDGGTYTLNLLPTLSDVTVTGGTYNTVNQTLTLTKSDGSTVSVSGFAIDTDVNWYTTGATFSTTTGVITGTLNNGSTWTVDIDGKYAESAHTHTFASLTSKPTTLSGYGITDAATSAQGTKADTAYGWGNHASAGYLTGVTNVGGYSGTLIYEDNRTISPNELAANRLKFGFTSWDNNNTSPYADFIHLRSYQDASGGSDNLVMFKKSGIGMRIWQQTYGSSTPYSSFADVWTTSNFSQSTVGNWNTAYGWGNHASAGYLTTHPTISGVSSNNSGRTYIQDILTDSNGHITGITTATETVVNTDTNYYTTGSTFNTTNGIITFTRNDGGTYTVDIDGKYAEASHTHSYVPLAGGTMTGSLLFSNDIGTAIQGTIGTNDFWRIYASSTASNAGYLEISTSDDGTEPIYVRQYTGVFATLVRTATLLDGSGNTSFPNTLTAGTIVKSGGTSSQYLMADGSVSTNPGWLTTHPTIAGASSNNSGRTYIQDVLTDSNGHVTGLTTASETVVNTDTNYFVSSASFDTGDGVLTLNRNGLSAVTVDLDGRYQATGTYLGAINYNNNSNANYQLLWGSGNAVYGTGDVYVNPSTDYVYANSFQSSDWFRSTGDTGWYNSTHGGGWYMTDSSYIRPYNGKSLSMGNGSIDYVSQLHFNDNVRFYDEGNNQYLNFKWGNTGAGGIKFVDGDSTVQGYVYGTGTGSFGLLDSNGSWKIRVNTTEVEHYANTYLTTVYANFIYDRDNTAYYLNPAGGSNLNTLTLNSTTAGSTVLNVQGTQGQLFSVTDDLTGDLFSVSDVSGVPIFNVNANGTVSIDALGSLTIGGNPVLTAHPSVTAAGSSNNSGRTYIQDILLDAFGHITGITTATETVVNTDTNTVTSVGIAGDLSTGNITLVGSGSTTVTKSGGTITITSTDTNTTYSVGDGGLTQFNFTTAFRDKLNGIEASANNYVHPTTTGNKHIPTGGSSGQILRWSADGTASWGSDVDTNTTYTAGTGLTLTGTVFSVTAGTYAAASHTHTFASLTSKPTTISGYGITDAITTGNIGSQSVDYATRSKWIDFPDGPRDLSDRRPDWNNRSVAWDFVNAATVGGSGNYAGVMTFSPWDGTAASTGDSSYQLAFHNQTGVNSSGAPGLKIRNGIDTTWKSWRRVALSNSTTFTNTTNVTFTHDLGTDNVVVQVYDSGGALFFPSSIRIAGGVVYIDFAALRSGKVVVTG